jgi:heme-degrading monooxygenase HmoA
MLGRRRDRGAEKERKVVTIGMNYLVLPGKEKIFEDACAKVVETMKGIEGHEASSIYREVGDGEPAYLIVSRWQSEQAFQDFVSSDAFKKVTNWGAQNILRARPQHTTYQHD